MTTLYFREGTSDKVYQTQVVPNGDLFDVTFAYGRRGSTMTTGKKNTMPLTRAEADKTFDKLVREKMAKGYHEGEDAPTYTATDNEDRYTGILPMLLNPIDERDLDYYLDADEWAAEEKFDGRRMMLRKQPDGTVEAINRKGLVIGAPESILKDARSLPGTFILDGEAIGETYHVFDYIIEAPIETRKIKLRYLLNNLPNVTRPSMVEVLTYQFHGKRWLLDDLRVRNAEGIVFKKMGGMYRPGRPASGGDGLKFKFVEEITCVVLKLNVQRSVAIALLDKDGRWVPVGNVTIPPNHEVPARGDKIDVRYLYATSGGILYQPIYKGPRADVDVDGIEKLKYRNCEEDYED